MSRNSFKNLGFPPEIMARAFLNAGIDPVRRGETLSMEEFARLSDELSGGTNEKNL